MELTIKDIDCNCNDCKFMVRDFEKFNKSLEVHRGWQLSAFEQTKSRVEANAEKKRGEGDPAHIQITKEINKLKFQFDKSECMINYGTCEKFEKEVSFIPNTCQLETQACFENRRK